MKYIESTIKLKRPPCYRMIKLDACLGNTDAIKSPDEQISESVIQCNEQTSGLMPAAKLQIKLSIWTPDKVIGQEIQFGIDDLPKQLRPVTPDVPCFMCHARTHLQATCPLSWCSRCQAHGHPARNCLVRRAPCQK